MDEDLGKLSTGQLNKLASVIDEAKKLTNQQVEIVEKVLAGEDKISSRRIGNLKTYFDDYSRKLDSIARKYSEIDDAFLVLAKRVDESYQALAENVIALKRQLNEATQAATSTKPSNAKEKTSSSDNEASSNAKENLPANAKAILELALTTLAEACREESAARIRAAQAGNNDLAKIEEQYQTQRVTQLRRHLDQLVNVVSSSTSLSAFTSLNQGQAENTPVENPPAASALSATKEIRQELVEALRREALSYYEPNSRATTATEELAATSDTGINTSSAVEQYVENSTRANLASSDDMEAVQNFLKQAAEMDKQLVQEPLLKERRTELNAVSELARKKEAINKAILDLELARSQEEEDLTNRSAEFRLNRLQEVTQAELAAQNLLNQIDLQLATTQASPEAQEAGRLRARQANAKADLEAAKELEKQIIEYRAALDLQSRLNNNGILTEAAAAANEQLTKAYFAERKDALIAEIKAEQLANEQLQHLKEEQPELIAILERKKAAFIAEEEYKARKRAHGKLTKEQQEQIKKDADEKYKLDEKQLERLEKRKLKELDKEKKARVQAGDRAVADAVSGALDKDHSLLDRLKELKDLAADAGDGDTAKTIQAGLLTATKALSTMAQQLETTVDQIASFKGDIDTRLQGSSNEKFAGSYWDQLTKDMMSVGAITPFFKQEDFANNIKELVNKGISFDLSQRAFLMTIQEKIANTFNVADGTLLRLIRIQQEDSTAGRLGMESALNSFLNEMYETTEYLTDVAASVRSSLEEMESLMSGAEATEIEYQVQKWMGSLYSVGMSQSAVQSISTALGQIASGQVDGLTNGGSGNLLVMAANNAGISIADMLANGLDAENTNKLLQATVDYLAEIAESSKDNNVVQQQLADVFGVKASDLRAAVNLGSTNTVASKSLSYDNMLNQLFAMAGSMYNRTSIGEMMSNVWANGQYTLAGSMSSNPISYLTYKAASLLDSTAGGIALPAISVMGNMVDLETTVADLMRVSSIGTGILGSLGSIISGLSSSFSGQAMLSELGIEKGSGLKVTPRGVGSAGPMLSGGGQTSTSGSGYVGNAAGSDIKDATIKEAEDSKKQQMIEAKEEEPVNQIDMINATVQGIYEVLDEVVRGDRSFRVRIDGYGLTGVKSSGAQGGVAGLQSSDSGSGATAGGSLGSSTLGSSTTGSTTNTGSGAGSAGINGGSIDLGGWTML